jgi:hypothetical protein
VAGVTSTQSGEPRVAAKACELWRRAAVYASVPFFLVACTFTYYGQLHRAPSGDTYGTVYTAVAVVEKHTIWLDSYLPYFQQHSGEHPYMLTTSSAGHLVTSTPTASSALALPLVGLFAAAGVQAQEWGSWMEAGMLTAALASAASVAIIFVLLTRLTTRPRAALIASTYAWGTLAWGINGQALWEHGGVALALSIALLALVDRRLTLAGAAITAMAAFRLTAPFIGIFLLPLVGRRPADWGRFALGALPLPLALGLYNLVAFGSPIKQGYGSAHLTSSLKLSGRITDGLPGLLLSPGRGLFVYSPVLLFAIYGAIKGRRVLLYACCAMGFLADLLVTSNLDQWYGGESFGARKLADTLPLLAVLLVPAVDAIVRTRWMLVYLAALAWSVLVQLLAASAWPDSWFGRHDLAAYSTWWHPFDNEITAMLSSGSTWPRVVLMAGISVLGIGVGLMASLLWTEFAGRRPA